jgi:hypothetical protein
MGTKLLGFLHTSVEDMIEIATFLMAFGVTLGIQHVR